MTASLPPEIELKKLHFRASHRGTREMDFLLGRFAHAKVGDMKGEERAIFAALLAEPDPEINLWILDAQAHVPGRYCSLIAQLRQFHGISGNARKPN